MSNKIFQLPREGNDFLNISIKNEFIISNKIVPKISLQDLILKYSEIVKKKKSIKLLTEENDFYSLEEHLRLQSLGL